jgi:hypothetical protein
MSLLTNLLQDIARQGSILEKELKGEAPNLFEPKPWKTYDVELPPRAAWDASQKIIADCTELADLLTPTKIKLLTDTTINWVTVAMGVACDLGIADRIIENGGEATLQHLAKVCNTDEHKLGKFNLPLLLIYRLLSSSSYESTYLCRGHSRRIPQ